MHYNHPAVGNTWQRDKFLNDGLPSYKEKSLSSRVRTRKPTVSMGGQDLEQRKINTFPITSSTILSVPLTHSTVQSPSCAADWFAASQEIPRISRNPKVHYRPHKRPPPVSILGQNNPVHIPTSHLLQIRPNIIESNILT